VIRFSSLKQGTVVISFSAMSSEKLATYTGISLLLLIMASSQARADILQGGVQTENFIPRGGTPGLRRQDMGDPFSGNNQPNPPVVQQMIQPPADAFDLQGLRPPPPPAPRSQPTNLQTEINQSQASDFQGLPGEGVPDVQPQSVPMLPPAVNAPQQANVEADQADPDKSPELQLAWDQWHRRVANAVYERYNAMAQMAFKYSRPLGVYVTYVVTRDGQITDVKLQQKSPNVAYNTLIILVIKSLSGQKALLQFPQGSKRFSVDKGGTFTQNYGGVLGFKYATGDRETVRPH
jgi:hypothetical protein